MPDTAPLLTPALARCHVLRTSVRAPSWTWEDFAADETGHRLAQPALPFDTDQPVPHVVGEDVGDEVRRMATSLARVFAEVLSGLRAPGQLNRWLDDPPLRVLAEAARTYRRTPPVVASVRVQGTGTGSYEVTMRLRRGAGFAAAAYRLDQRRGRWRCTALVVGP
ncbi:MAG TPA: Rv3235 family protein [Propionibacteriaceae bacterium]|nr:Rv3235 family protein [Propionibacteriaceae bacterium]